MSEIKKSFHITDVVYDSTSQTTDFTFIQNPETDVTLTRVLKGVSSAEGIAEEIKDIIIKYFC